MRTLVLRKLLTARRMGRVSVQFNRAMDKTLSIELGVRRVTAACPPSGRR